jgi:hypothetical protein
MRTVAARSDNRHGYARRRARIRRRRARLLTPAARSRLREEIDRGKRALLEQDEGKAATRLEVRG